MKAERILDHSPVSIFDIRSKYRDDLMDAIDRAPGKVRDFIKNHGDDILFINERAEINREGMKGIWVNLKKDAMDRRGKWCATFHEIGHRVDRLAGRPSSSPSFEKALRNDFDNLVKAYQTQYNISKAEAYAEISEVVKDARYHSVSDLFGGMSDNQCVGIYAHRNVGYWECPGRLSREAYAHFFEAYGRADADKIDVLKQTFPNAYKMFEDMMEKLK